MISAAVFRKELSDVIFRSQWKLPNDPSTIYFQERNGSSGKATGLELAWQQALTFLPKPLDGFGVKSAGNQLETAVTPPGHLTGSPLPFSPVQPHPAVQHLEHALGAYQSGQQLGQMVKEIGQFFATERLLRREGPAGGIPAITTISRNGWPVARLDGDGGIQPLHIHQAIPHFCNHRFGWKQLARLCMEGLQGFHVGHVDLVGHQKDRAVRSTKHAHNELVGGGGANHGINYRL